MNAVGKRRRLAAAENIIKVTEMATELHYKPHYHLYKRKELEAYLELPKDIKKVAPLLLIFPLPGLKMWVRLRRIVFALC